MTPKDSIVQDTILPPADRSYGSVNIGGYAHAIVGDVHIRTGDEIIAAGVQTLRAKNDFLKSLSFPELDYRYHAIEPAFSKTCTWFLRHKLYRRWNKDDIDGEYCPLLWLRGKPGAGKSTIMKVAVDEIKQRQKKTGDASSKTSVNAFFFNARGSALETVPEGCYRSLIHQLLETRKLDIGLEPLATYIRKRDVISEGWRWTESELRTMFRQAIHIASQKSSIVLFVDALDECDSSTVRSLVDFLVHEINIARAQGIDIRACVSSRHYPNISLPHCRIIVAESNNTEDIKAYIDANVGSLDYSSDFQNKIAREASGIFLWTKMIINKVRDAIDDGEPQATLSYIISSTPQDLQTIFQNLWTSLKPFELVQSRSLLLFVLFAKQPMNLNQLALLFAFQKRYTSLSEYLRSDDFMTMEQMEKFINKSTRGLIEINKGAGHFGGNIVQFIHGTVREYFLDNPGQLVPTVSTNEEMKNKANDMMARACFNFVSVPDPRAYSDQRRMGYWCHPLVKYAGLHAFRHAREAEEAGSSQAYLLEVLRLGIPDPRRWVKLPYDGTWSGKFSLKPKSILRLCVENNLISVIEGLPHLAEAKADSNTILKTAMLDAIRRGRPAMDAILERKGVQSTSLNGGLEITHDDDVPEDPDEIEEFRLAMGKSLWY